MARRTGKNATGTWWAAGALIVAVGVLLWWLSARRAEAPGLPASQPGARALSVPPDLPEHAHDEITNDEKADLARIIQNGGREPGAPPPNGVER